MFKAPLIVGVHQAADWRSRPIKDTLQGLGENTGNMMFTESLLRAISGAKWGSFSLTPEELDGRDAIVLAAANWINSFEDFGWLVERLERSKLPVILVGVGAQSSLKMEIPVLKPGTLKLLQLVSQRSESIAARGAFTCEVLSSYGINIALPTGCPSLLLAGRAGPSIAFPDAITASSCCVHSTRHGFNSPGPFDAYIYRQAFEQNLDIVLQSEIADICVALRLPESDFDYERASKVLKLAYGCAELGQISKYLSERAHFFANFESWISFMKTKSFCVGTRIHGTVASIIAGTAATLIVHDSRTLEMAESMSIPYVLSSTIDVDVPFRAESFFIQDGVAALKSAYQNYRNRYVEFFLSNNLSIQDR